MNKHCISIFLGAIFYILLSNPVFAQVSINDIAENVIVSTTYLPGLISALAYLSGLLIAVTAIFKTIEHVSNPTQVPIRVPIIRFLIGGGLFALPIIIEATLTTINGGAITSFDPLGEFSILFDLSSAFGTITAYLGVGNINSILNSMMYSMGEIPGFVAALAYLLGLIMVVSALYKTRDHVEDPDRAPLKDAVIRYLTAGMLFALPTVFDAMYTTINGSGLGFVGSVMQLVSGAQFFISTDAGVACNGLEWTGLSAAFGSSATLGTVLCTVMQTSSGLPGFLAALSYIIGTVFGLWAIIKIRDHVNNPSQVPLHEGITRLLAGGAFFALPVVALALQYSVTPNLLAVSTLMGTNTGFVEPIPLSCSSLLGAHSLDKAMACFMDDILGPGHVLLNFFTFVAGLIFVMIGISRLTKSAQEGAKGPGGIGTLTTFLVGGFLMSATTILRAFSGAMFGAMGTQTSTSATLVYTTGMSVTEQAAAYNVINAVLKFMIIIGMISFVRGIFIMRDVSEGGPQASVMSGMTHLIGGALAVNLGPLLNAVQASLGVTAFGITFS